MTRKHNSAAFCRTNPITSAGSGRQSGQLSLGGVKSPYCPRRFRQDPIFRFLPTEGERPMNYECQERRADIILLPCLLLIKKDVIKNASIRIGRVLITRYIINQAVYCSEI